MMARSKRRNRSRDQSVDLFSFLNIMTATIGVQTLLLVVFALQIKPGIQSVQLLPAGGAGAGKQGNYIICNGNGNLEVLESGKGIRKISINDNKIDTIMDRINNQSSPQYVVIGVRPSGFSDFESIRSKLEYREMQFGYEPIEKNLEIKFPQQDLRR